MKRKFKDYVILLLIALFGISCFSVYPESHAKYIKEEIDKLSYEATLYKLTGNYKTIGINRIRSTSTEGYFYILFDRNTLMYDNDLTDHYRVTVGSNNTNNSSLCKIDSISSKGTSSKVSNYIYDITYNNNDSDTAIINVVCTMDEEYYLNNPSDYINLSISVVENIDGEKDFNYINNSYVLTTYQEYYDIYGSLYKKALSYVQNLYRDTPVLSQAAVDYFNTAFNTDSDIENNTLDGFNYDSSTGTFSIDDNFLEYARTYYYTINGNGTYYFYFDSNVTDATVLNNLFEYYLNKYTNYSTEDYTELINYVNSKTDGIKYVLDTGLTGFSVLNDTTNNQKVLSFTDSIIDIAKEFNHPTPVSVITIEDSYQSTMKAYLKGYIKKYEGLSDNVKTGLVNKINTEPDNELVALVTTNASNTGISQGNEFSGFYYDTFDTENIMAIVYSNGDGNTHIKFYNLEEGNTVSYTSPNEITETEYNDFVDDVHELVYTVPEPDEQELPDPTIEDGFYIYDYVIEE